MFNLPIFMFCVQSTEHRCVQSTKAIVCIQIKSAHKKPKNINCNNSTPYIVPRNKNIYVKFQISHHSTYNQITHKYTRTLCVRHTLHTHAHPYNTVRSLSIQGHVSRERHNRIIGCVYAMHCTHIYIYIICRWRHQRMATINIQMDNGVIRKKRVITKHIHQIYIYKYTLPIQTHARSSKKNPYPFGLLVAILTPKPKRTETKTKKYQKQYNLCVCICVDVLSNYIAANLRW